MRICVIGTGYVGLVTGACFAEFGVDVTCVDTDVSRIERLRQGHVPIHEPGLEEIVAKNVKEGRLHFTTSHAEAISSAVAVFVAVGTPPLPDGQADLSYVREVARSFAEHLNGYKVIVTKSTVPAGTGSMIRDVVEKELAKRAAGGATPHPFSVASNPEFLREGSAVEDFLRPNRVVIGTEDAEAITILKELYGPLYLLETPFVVTDVVTAELIKYASNAFLAVKISFINEIANLAEALGADVHQVAKGMGLDQRIGNKFLHPGPGYGGSCFPKDTRALAQIARAKGMVSEITEAAIRVNDLQAERMLEKAKRALGGSFEGRKVAILGLAFKPNTDDVRESRSLVMATRMLAEGATVRAHDPVAMKPALEEVPGMEAAEDAFDACRGAELVILATEWNQYRQIDLDRLRQVVARPAFLDLRNVYDRDRMTAAGFTYEGVGRGGRIG
jgi:UDPglucose 6-dehydrogenase